SESIDYIRAYSYNPASSDPASSSSAPAPTTVAAKASAAAAVDPIIGSGSDQLKLSISEDAYNGDVQYEVFVDGTQVGGIKTAHASHAAGQSDQLTVLGNWGSGPHDASIVFLNDAYNGTSS